MKKPPDTPSRRKLLAGAGLGAVLGASKTLPTHWSRPLVDTVMVPVHAFTTGPGPCDVCSDTYCDQGIIISVSKGVVQISIPGAAPGSGTCSGNGFFGFAVGDFWFEGTIAADCSNVSGGWCVFGCCEEPSPCNGTFDFEFNATPEGVCQVLCLLHGSPVAMADGSQRAVEQLRAGDQVLGYDESRGVVIDEVTLVIPHHRRSSHFVINDDLRITNDHPVLVQQENETRWLRAQEVEVGMRLRGLDQVVTVERIEYIEGTVLTAYVETTSGSFITTGRASYVVQSSYGQGLLAGDQCDAILRATAA